MRKHDIVRIPSPTFKKGAGGVNFDYLPKRGESEKLKKGGESMVQGKVLLKKKGGGKLTLFVFNSFKVYHFYILKLLYPLGNCVMHLKENYFFLSP